MSLSVSVLRELNGFRLAMDFKTDGRPSGLLGASGSGKSMTLRTIAGIEKPDSGRIVLNGRVLFDSEKKIDLPPQERKVGYLFQNYALFPTMTAAENIGISLKLPKKQKAKAVANLIKTYHLEGLAHHYPHQLSGGQQQRVALARMMASEPELILLDEPFSALDAYLREQMLHDLLDMLKSYKGDVLLVSHSRDDIYKCCETLKVISKGEAIQSGETKTLFANPRTMEVCRLTGCKNISEAKKIDDHTIFVREWGCRLKTAEVVPYKLKGVGIRGHFMHVTNGPGENVIRVIKTDMVEAPFEYQYRLKPAEGGASIWWLVSKQEGEAALQKAELFLRLPPESLMLLT